MATHSSILAELIFFFFYFFFTPVFLPGESTQTEEPGGLQSCQWKTLTFSRTMS